MRFVIATALAIASLSSHAFVYCDDPARWTDLRKAQKVRREAMVERRFAEIDQHFSAILAAYERGDISDAEVDIEFDFFSTPRAQDEPLHAEWIGAFPKSRAARLAHAYYWSQRGYASRGGDLAAKTSAVQFAAMEHAFKKAWAELDAAEGLAKTPLPEWAARLQILRATGSGTRDMASPIYRKAIATQPRTLHVRIAYARISAPQWGGSFEKLAAIRDDARSLAADDRRFVQSRVNFEIARAYHFRDEVKPAAEAYERALQGCPAYGGPDEELIRIYQDAKDYPALARVTTWLVERYPNYARAYASRAWAHQNMKKNDEAFRDYERAAQLGFGAAFEYLAYMTEWGRGTKQDYRKAIDLYMIAHSKGVKGAKEKADKIRAGLGIR